MLELAAYVLPQTAPEPDFGPLYGFSIMSARLSSIAACPDFFSTELRSRQQHRI